MNFFFIYFRLFHDIFHEISILIIKIHENMSFSSSIFDKCQINLY